jgi:hypothetical protein
VLSLVGYSTRFLSTLAHVRLLAAGYWNVCSIYIDAVPAALPLSRHQWRLQRWLTYFPVMECVSVFFSKEIAIAIAFITDVSTKWDIISVFIAQQMIEKYEFPRTMRCISSVTLVNAIIMVILAN